ncbi:hypothetical protein HDU93_002943, partial [Gonapodya sp. JEL0774]
GSDMGGSLRTPAAFCSVVGFRPSPGVIGDDGRDFAYSGLSVLGPMARTVEDVVILMSAQAGYVPGDPLCPPIPETLDPVASYSSLPSVDLSKLKMVWSTDLGFAPVDNDIRRVFEDKLQRLLTPVFAPSSRAATKSELSMLSTADRIFSVLRGESFAANWSEKHSKWWDQLGYPVQANSTEGRSYTYEDRGKAQMQHSKLVKEFERWWKAEGVDIMVVPTAAVSPFPHTSWAPMSINGQPLRNYFSWLALVYGVTVTAHPVLSIPLGVNHLGLPFGVQIVGPRWGDRFTLAVGQALEKVLAAKGEGRVAPDLEKLKDMGGKVGIEVESEHKTLVNLTSKCRLHVDGMRCGSCVAAILHSLKSMSGIIDVKASLLSEKVEVSFNSYIVTQEKIASIIDSIGFDATILESNGSRPDVEWIQEMKREYHAGNTSGVLDTQSSKRRTLTFHITGMTCASCVSTLEKLLGRLSGITSTSVSLLTNTAKVSITDLCGGQTPTPEEIVTVIGDAGYEAVFIPDTFSVISTGDSVP